MSAWLLSGALRHCAICNQAGSQEAHTGAHMAEAPRANSPSSTQSHTDTCTHTPPCDVQFTLKFFLLSLETMSSSLVFSLINHHFQFDPKLMPPRPFPDLKTKKKTENCSSSEGSGYATFFSAEITHEFPKTGSSSCD